MVVSFVRSAQCRGFLVLFCSSVHSVLPVLCVSLYIYVYFSVVLWLARGIEPTMGPDIRALCSYGGLFAAQWSKILG